MVLSEYMHQEYITNAYRKTYLSLCGTFCCKALCGFDNLWPVQTLTASPFGGILVIIGIDPGTQVLGYGVLEKNVKGVRFLAGGVLRCGKHDTFPKRLASMAAQVAPLLRQWQPQACVIEKIFLGKNVDSAFKLGHVRGICMFEALNLGAEVFEYTPRSVKQGITGSGAASKEQVQMLLYSQLGVTAAKVGTKEMDASDALALAFYHSMRMDLMRRFQGTGIDI